MSFDAITFGIFKVGGIVVVSDELLKTSDPSAASLIRVDLAAAVAQFTDVQSLDPVVSAVAGVSPASVTYGAPAIPSTGSTAAQVTTDLGALLSAITTRLISTSSTTCSGYERVTDTSAN